MVRSFLLGRTALLAFAAALVLVSAAGQGHAIENQTAKGTSNGCVSCHIKDSSSDRRLTVFVAKIKGHPDIAKIVKIVPKDCGICHKSGPRPPQLRSAVHKMHSKGFALSAFAKKPEPACLKCHTVNAKSGSVGIKNGPRNW